MAGSRPLVFRAAAHADVEAAVAWYAHEADAEVVARFLAELEAAYAHIAAHPGTGSPRWSQALSVPGLRHWSLGRFPYLVFFVEHADGVHVVRVLHGARDIPATLAESNPAARP